jgi:hypothetical protein
MDPGAFGGGDLSGGFGGMDQGAFSGGADPSTFGGMDFGSPQAAAEFGAQQSAGTPNQPPITDQPSVPPQAPPQAPAPPQSSVPPGNIGHGDLLMDGIPQEDLRLTSTPTTEGMGTPGTQVASVKWLDTIGGAEAKPADPVTDAKVVTPEIVRPPTGNVPPTAGASQGPMLQPEGDVLPHGLQGEGDPYYGRPQAPDLTGSRYDAGPETGTTPPTSTASAGPMMEPGAIPDNLIKNTPPLTPETTAQPGTAGGGVGTPGAGGAAPAGQGPQSPLEQLVSGFLHMLLGGGHGGLGPLEQLIARMVGINPNRLFPRFYGGNPFARQAGPGYFPPGTVGGRAIGPGQGVPPGGQRTPSPQRAPGAPQTPPGATRPTLAPSRRRQGGLPGGIYTAGRPDQPPPWYHPERNPAAASRRSGPTTTNTTGPHPDARAAGEGTANNTGIPDRILGEARQLAMMGQNAVKQFIHSMGVPVSTNWCGEFAAAALKAVGVPTPANPEVASNWRNWGTPTTTPQPGDIAIRKQSYHPGGGYVRTGETGSHVTTVESISGNQFNSIGGNQGQMRRSFNLNDFEFRTWNNPQRSEIPDAVGF